MIRCFVCFKEKETEKKLNFKIEESGIIEFLQFIVCKESFQYLHVLQYVITFYTLHSNTAKEVEKLGIRFIYFHQNIWRFQINLSKTDIKSLSSWDKKFQKREVYT